MTTLPSSPKHAPAVIASQRGRDGDPLAPFLVAGHRDWEGRLFLGLMLRQSDHPNGRPCTYPEDGVLTEERDSER